MRANIVKIRTFRDVLSDKLISIFNQTFLPRRIRIGKINDNTLK